MIKKTIIINLIFIIVLVVLLEFAVKSFNLSGIMGMDSHLIEKVNFIHKLKKNNEGKVFGKTIYTDSNAFRVPSRNFRYSKNKSSIFFIGDSTTFGNGVDEPNTFVGKLRIEKKKFNFLNSAVPGYQIIQHEKNINILREFRNIKKIFYVFTLNDVFEINQIYNVNEKKDGINPDDSFFDKLKKIKIFSFINIYLRNKSYLYMFIKGIASDPPRRHFKHVLSYYKNKNEYMNVKNYFIKLKKYSDRNNIDLTILILPYEFQTRKNNCYGKNLIPQSTIEKILISSKIEYRNYTSLFCNFKNPKKLYYKFDPMHLSKEGHSLIFLEIEKEI